MHPASQTPALARTSGGWQGAVIAAFGLGGLTVTSWGPRMPAVQQELAADAATIGILLACVTAGSLCGLVSSAPLLRLLGNRGALRGAILTAALGLGGVGAANIAGSTVSAGAAFAVTGFGVGLLDVLVNLEAAAIERQTRRVRMPLMHGSWSVGAAVGAGVGAACAALQVSAAAQFLGTAVLAAAAAPLLVRAVPARPPEPKVARPRRTRPAGRIRAHVDLRLLFIGAVMLGVELGEGSANSWLSLAAHTGHGVAPATSAALLIVFAITEAAARIFGGPLVERVGRAAAVAVTACIGILGVALFIAGGNLTVIVIGVALWAAGVSMGFPLGMSAAAEGPHAASRVSTVASIGYCANLAGPPAIGAVAQRAGLLTALWLVVASFALAFAAAPALRRAGRQQAGPQPAAGED